MAVPTIKAIETAYAGYRFRSRLEARWAVFFDSLGTPWEYEAQGFLIDNERYLPDFHLRGKVCDGRDVAVEVKGVLTGDDLKKILLLGLTGQPVLLMQEIPREGASGPHFWLFHRNLGKGNSIDVAYVAVGFYETRSHEWRLVPFGWSAPAGAVLDDEALRNQLADGFQRADIAKAGGWTKVPTRVQAAYRAARQARFEHGERG